MGTLLFSADNSEVHWDIGAAANFTSAFTVALVVRPEKNALGFQAFLNHMTAGDAVVLDFEMNNSYNLYAAISGQGQPDAINHQPDIGTWQIYGFAKPPGAAVPTFAYYSFATGQWNVVTIATPLVGNAGDQSLGQIVVGAWSGSDDLQAHVAVVGGFPYYIGGDVGSWSALSANLATTDWLAAGPAYLFELTDNADIPDLTGNDNTFASCTATLDPAVDPPGWTYGIGPPPPPPQLLRPDADVTTTGWSAAPLYTKLGDQSDATVVTATSA